VFKNVVLLVLFKVKTVVLTALFTVYPVGKATPIELLVLVNVLVFA
jgi:hypothetical protein